MILQAWGPEERDRNETLDVNLGADNVIYKLVHNSCPFPPIKPGASTDFQRRHIACGIEYHLREKEIIYHVGKVVVSVLVLSKRHLLFFL